MIMILIRAHLNNISILQIYAPTSESNEASLEKFYTGLDNLTKYVKKQEKIIAGEERLEDNVCDYGLGARNE